MLLRNFRRSKKCVLNSKQTPRARSKWFQIVIMSLNYISWQKLQFNQQPFIKVLGLIFDHKMSWGAHVEKLLKEANSRTQAVRHIHSHLTKAECLNVAQGLFFSNLYYCSSVWVTDMLPKSLMKRVTTAPCACLRAVFGYKIKDISTEYLHKEADILTPNQ